MKPQPLRGSTISVALPTPLFLPTLILSLVLLTGISVRLSAQAVAGPDCHHLSQLIYSDYNWVESSVVTQTPRGKSWAGVSSLPPDASFSKQVDTGQAYPNWSRPVVAGASNIVAGNNIRYFRKYFQVDSLQDNSAEFTMYFDDNVEVYINGHRLFRKDTTTNSSFKGMPHHVHFKADGSVVTGGAGYDEFDRVYPAHLDTVLKVGLNSLTVVIRNFGGSQNKGGFSLKLALGTSAFKVEASSPDSLSCNTSSVMLSGSSNAVGGQPMWTTTTGMIQSGATSYTPVVIKKGWYYLSVTDTGGCTATDSVYVVNLPCVVPYFPPPDSGKSFDLIGSELSSLAQNPGYQDSLQYVFLRQNDSVFIEVIAIKGQYAPLLALLQSPGYGMTHLIDNGPGSLIISGLFPIYNLPKLDSLPLLINYVRPLFPPLVNAGIALSQGDEAVRGDFARNGFKVYGENVKVGVLSDSYNSLSGNPAQADVLNEDLPGAGNSMNPTPVQLLKEYPFGARTDEGRAMLQIIHDVAPKAELAFRTGYVSAGDMAKGIYELYADSCEIIVDDITYITEPFLKDGVVAKAVDSVSAMGVSYFSAAGNFGSKSYAGTFSPLPAPGDLVGSAHDFGGGDIFQRVSLQPGTYTIVLQWQDSIYSIGETTNGTSNDLDIYLTDDFGNTLFGFNRNNLKGDPLEILSFTVTQSTQSNILITRSAGSQNVYFKYVVFRGELSIDEHQSGGSTVVGQANADGAIAVGAVLFSNTPAFGVNPPSIASFSSRGGTPVNGSPRNKPDITAPNGVNTSVELGGVNIDGDVFPNFFGTSAAAPHAAAVAALLQSAMQKFEGGKVTPSVVRQMLSNTAIDMESPGFDYASGHGLVQADQLLLSVANPTPSLSQISFMDTTQQPGTDSVDIILEGDYLTASTKILMREDTLPGTFINEHQIQAVVPPFTGNPALRAYTAPITSSLADGGFSDTLQFFTTSKSTVQVIADDQMKKYSEAIPELTFHVLVDSIPLGSTAYSLADLGLDSLLVTTTATALSDVGNYLIRPHMPVFDPADPLEAGLTEIFDYQFVDAVLTISPMPLSITAEDTTILLGEKIVDFQFSYSFPDSLVDPADKSYFQSFIATSHDTSLANALALVNAQGVVVGGRALVNADVENLTYMASGRALVNARALVNSIPSTDTTYVVDIALESIFDYQDYPDSATLANAYPLVNARALVNALGVVSGRALVNAQGIVGGRALVNGLPLVNAYPLVNGTPVKTDSSDVVLIVDEDDLDSSNTDTLLPFTPINLVTGLGLGQHAIVPGAFLNKNYSVTYQIGTLTVVPATDSVSIVSDTSWRTSTYTTNLNANPSPWPGMNGNLPAAATFSLPVTIGQPYPWNPIDTVEGTQIFKAPGGITFYRTTFNLTHKRGVEARITSYMDDGIEVYVNRHLLTRETDRDVKNFDGVPHELKIHQDGSYTNAFMGGDGFDVITNLPMDSAVVTGENELIVVLRNASSGDKGGLSFRMNIVRSPLIIKKSGLQPLISRDTQTADFSLNIYPNPSQGQISLIPRHFDTGKGLELMLYDIRGRLQKKIPLRNIQDGEPVNISLEAYPSGMYFLRCVSGGQSITLKLLLEK